MKHGRGRMFVVVPLTKTLRGRLEGRESEVGADGYDFWYCRIVCLHVRTQDHTQCSSG